MILKSDKKVIGIRYGSKNVTSIYKGDKLVWSPSRSCFGSGGWDNDLPWDNNDGWTN